MTPAEVLAEYLGLTPETHPACYFEVPLCSETREYAPLFVCPTHKTNACLDCDFEVNMPDPLAPGTEADVWLGVLMRSEKFCRLKRTEYDRYLAAARTRKSAVERYSSHPTPAIVRAMMAADSAFAAKMEGAEG